MGLDGFPSVVELNSLFSFECLDSDGFESRALGADFGVLDRVLGLCTGVLEFELEEEEEEW